MSQGAKTTENTAVNRLIELAQQKPLEVDEDLFLDATARAAREAAKRAMAAAPPQPAPAPARTVAKAPSTGKTLPPPFRATGAQPAQAIPRPSQGFAAATPAPELLRAPVEEVATRPFDMAEAEEVDLDTPIPAPLPTRPAPSPMRSAPLPAVSPMSVDEASWFEASQAVEKVDDEYLVGTHGVPKQRANQTLWYVAGAFGLGLALAAVFFWPGSDAAPPTPPNVAAAGVAPLAQSQPTTPAPAPAVTVTPMPEPTPAPVPEIVPVPEPVAAPEVVPAPVAVTGPATVRFESTPTGANVVLVQDGQMIPLGIAPIAYPLEPSKRYEVMFTLEGHASLVVPVDPVAASRVSATMGASGSTVTIVKPDVAPVAVAAVEAEEAETETEEVEAVPAPVVKPVAKKKAERVEAPVRKTEKKKAPEASASASGTGTLKIGAKPPCDVLLDGKKVGTSPIANLKVKAGKHTLTLINREFGIKEKVSVTVKAGETVKVVKDLTKRMK